jgi:hypothetical protein
MFKKLKEKNKNKPQIETQDILKKHDLSLHEEEANQVNTNNIEPLKKDKKWNLKGIKVQEIKEDLKLDSPKEFNVKKQFFSEKLLLQTNDPEEKKKLLGMKREEIQQEKDIRKQKALDAQMDLYTLPDNLKSTPSTKNDYVETLLKLSDAGLIEVPMQLETKFKQISETTNPTQKIDPKLAEEIDYLNVLKRVGPSYSKGFKPDIPKKMMPKLNKMFGDAFVEGNTRKRKLQKERIIMENQMLEREGNKPDS